MPEPLLIAPKTAIVCNNMDSGSARSTAPTEQVSTTAQPDSHEPEPPALCAAGKPTKLPVEVKTAEAAKERVRNTPEPPLVAPRAALVCDNMGSCSESVTAPTHHVPVAAKPESAEPELPSSCAARKPAKLLEEVKSVNLHRFIDVLALPIIPAPPLAEVTLLGNAIQPPCQDDCSGPSDQSPRLLRAAIEPPPPARFN
eukprot:TRINITY_DN947_c0_g1_i8.p2 TRINITY_DN947_c0_g1~~TRINITY_DN947_c0_g1_i8.p2  ORF type:complete len:199 (+),score=11.78 TRINITY_DN947_c0_g1_i8:670-1266(+)